jgi:hypothetical protein
VIHEKVKWGDKVRGVEWYPSRAALQSTTRTGYYPQNMRWVDWCADDGLGFYVMNASDEDGSDHIVYNDGALGTCRRVWAMKHLGEPGKFADRLAMDWLCHGVTPTLDGKRGVSPRALMGLSDAAWGGVYACAAHLVLYRFRAQVERRKYVVRVDVT